MGTSRRIQIVTGIIMLFISGCSPSQNLAGLWKTETQHQDIIINGQAKMIVDVYQTIEFSNDGSFKIEDVVKAKGKEEKLMQLNGTFKIVDTNNVILELAPSSMMPSNKIPLHVQYAISNKFLRMDAISTSVVPEKNTYRRVR